MKAPERAWHKSVEFNKTPELGAKTGRLFFVVVFFFSNLWTVWFSLLSLSFCFHPNFSTPPGEPTDQRLLLISMHSVHSDSCGPAIFHQSAAQHFYTANVEMELDSGVRGCVFRAAFISNRGRKNLRDEIFPLLSSPLAHLARDRTAPDNQMTEEILHGSPQCALFDIDTIRGGRLKRKIVKYRR